jgi:hypothetical protein
MVVHLCFSSTSYAASTLFGGTLANGQLWEDYFLVLETLEEKAPHLIQQIVSRVAVLAGDSGASSGDTTSHPLHLSWLLIIFTRFFQHQNTVVIRQGLDAFLSTTAVTSCEQGRVDAQLLADFLVKRLFHVLNESRIYSVVDEDGGSSSNCKKVHLGETIRCFFMFDYLSFRYRYRLISSKKPLVFVKRLNYLSMIESTRITVPVYCTVRYRYRTVLFLPVRVN